MKMKPCSKTGVRLIYFYLSKSPFKLCFCGSRLNNLVPRAFLHFDKKDWRINCFHYFARPSFISKSENPNGCNEIEQKILCLTLREVSRNANFLWLFFFRTRSESYPGFLVYEENRRFCDSVYIRENTDQRMPTFCDISRSVIIENLNNFKNKTQIKS